MRSPKWTSLSGCAKRRPDPLAARKAPRYSRRIIYLLIYLSLIAVFSFAFYDSYYRHLDCFNERGRCFDPETAIVYTEGGMVWGLLAAIFATLAALSLIRLTVTFRR